MSKLPRIIAILTVSMVLAVPWIWLFSIEGFAIAIIFDATVLSVVLLANNDRETTIKKEIEKERKRNLPTRPPVKVLDTSTGTMEISEECAKCGLIITPTMVKKEKDGLFYHLSCFPGAHAN